MPKSELYQIGDRLKKVRMSLGLSQEKMGGYFDIGQSTYGQKEQGKSGPTLEMLSILYIELNVNLHWLLFGDGYMFRNSEEPILREADINYGLSQRMSKLEQELESLKRRLDHKE